MDEARTTRLRRLIAMAALVTIPAAVAVACSPSSSAEPTTKTFPPEHIWGSTTTSSTAVRPIPVETHFVSPETTTIPEQTTTTQPPAAAPGCFADLALQVGWPAEAVPHLTYIIERESHCDPSSNTGYRPSTGDWSLGLLQINTLGSLLEARQAACGIGAREELLDPATNLRCGLALYRSAGFGPWGG